MPLVKPTAKEILDALPQSGGSAIHTQPVSVKNTSDLHMGQAHVLIFGPTKAGKTTTTTTLVPPDKLRIISAQPEEQLASIKKKNIIYSCVENAAQLDAILLKPRSHFPGDWTALSLDDMSEMIEFYVEKYEATTTDGRQVYKKAGRHLRDRLKPLLTADFHVIGTAGERDFEDKDTGIAWRKPNLPPSMMDLVTTKFSFLFYLGDNHKLITKRDPSARIMAGNRLPLDRVNDFQKAEDPNLGALWSKFQKAITPTPEGGA